MCGVKATRKTEGGFSPWINKPEVQLILAQLILVAARGIEIRCVQQKDNNCCNSNSDSLGRFFTDPKQR